jgi:monoamine oxidase
VTALDWSADPVRVTTGTATYLARRVVVAVPPALVARVSYTPELPAGRRGLLAGLPTGSVVKVNVVYDEPFWRADGLSGQANSDARALNTVFDNVPYGGHPGVLVGFFEGAHARAAATLSPEDRRRLAIGDLVGYFGPRAAKPSAYLERDWCAEQWSLGCYGAFATPGTLSRFGAARARSGRCTAPAPRRRPAGPATSTARWSPASGRPLRSSPRRVTVAVGERAGQCARRAPV